MDNLLILIIRCTVVEWSGGSGHFNRALFAFWIWLLKIALCRRNIRISKIEIIFSNNLSSVILPSSLTSSNILDSLGSQLFKENRNNTKIRKQRHFLRRYTKLLHKIFMWPMLTKEPKTSLMTKNPFNLTFRKGKQRKPSKTKISSLTLTNFVSDSHFQWIQYKHTSSMSYR